MITAALLCSHLALAHAVTHCHTESPMHATFDGGLLIVATDKQWTKFPEEPFNHLWSQSYGPIHVFTLNEPDPKIHAWLGLLEDGCAALDWIKDLQQQIKTEWANPSGVSNLSLLNNLGWNLQMRTDQYQAVATQYLQMTKQTFVKAVCQ